MSNYHALASQVGGHAGVMATEDGSLIIKPSLQREHDFYQLINQQEDYATLRPLIPKFFGTLKLEGQIDPEGSGGLVEMDDREAAQPKDKFFSLENISGAFTHPNIMDIKLGTTFYDESTSTEKKARMEKVAHETTSFEVGVRLTGFQVYDYNQSEPVITPKSYGKSISVSQLPEGIARFFPVASASSDKLSGQGLPKRLLVPILHGIKSQIERIKSTLEDLEMTIIGGSLLIVYEADWERAEKDLEELPHPEDVEDVEDNIESDEEEEETMRHPATPYAVKLIDFAHAHFTPGRGPDQGVLKGIQTTLQLIEGRIKEVQDG